MAQLTEWLKLMVAEINRKREDDDRAKEEASRRQTETPQAQSPKAVA